MGKMELMALIPLFAMDDGIPTHNFENIIENLTNPNIHLNENRRRARIKYRNRHYYERTIPRFTYDQFKEMFRMDRAICEVSNCVHEIINKISKF